MSETKVTTFEDKIFQSYLDQTYRIANLTLGPASENIETTITPTGFILSAWSPNGKSKQYKDNLAFNWELQKLLQSEKLTFQKVVQVEKTRAWVEDAFLVQGITRKKALQLAIKFKQSAFVEITTTTAIVHSTRSSRTASIKIGQITREFGCPAKKDGESSSDFCKPHGYWTTSQAIKALSIWQENLTIVNSRLGCNLCNNVTTHPNNFARTTKPERILGIPVTNRYSIAQWVRL